MAARMPGVNRQGQAHIVSTAIRSPGPARGPAEVGGAGPVRGLAEVGGAPSVRTWFSIDPQPASISATINISVVFICAFRVDYGQSICHSAIKNDSSTILATENVSLCVRMKS